MSRTEVLRNCAEFIINFIIGSTRRAHTYTYTRDGWYVHRIQKMIATKLIIFAIYALEAFQ